MCAMPSIRLNNDLRTSFKRKVLEEIMPHNRINDPRHDAKLGQKLLDELYTQAHKDLFQQLPEKYRALEPKKEISCFYFSKNTTNYRRQNIEGFSWTIPEQEVPDCFRSVYYFSPGDEKRYHVLPYDHWASQLVIKSKKEFSIYREQRTMLESKLDELLEGVNSSRQLFNAWPDAIKYKHFLPIPDAPIARAQKVRKTPTVSREDMDLSIKLATATYKRNI